jgi:hypothetical protein
MESEMELFNVKVGSINSNPSVKDNTADLIASSSNRAGCSVLEELDMFRAEVAVALKG